MPLEIVFLPAQWFQARTSFPNLTKLLNKGYDKPRLKYDIIQTPRIQSDDSLLENLAVKSDDEIGVFLLLGGEEEFKSLKEQGFERDFNDTLLQNAFDCDIPAEFASYFDLAKLTKAPVTIADASYELSDQIRNRVLASLGFRSYYKKSAPTTKPFILTAYTSFIKNAASLLLEFVLNELLQDPTYFNMLSNTGDISKYDRLSIHADCIVEHGLVGYYTTKCRFETIGDKVHVQVGAPIGGDASSASYKAIEASRDFHIAYIRREVNLR
ncbi:hypothetical protein FOB58_002831 [Candida parapsilosis]|uniref:Uncharacterized protein n=2 Tax=Candida parapsilosis TaxID=5480 RepID=G8B7R6_CANPC|nr:uncharacterized protein CPAR2_105370 [Candida parapsilosis]KAF6048490.1 hypothetical protein FOB59_003532 [Candida parapsilosis]KAF6049554.1 hypothetical protein FOB58_002831 [Candida parapsilosis]KAF6057405.1 hypothetical protein FOB60_001960 [Candida parapsilosis]KAF6065876.1 hypothetical protein FOB61_001946 [Candida parapsilosis]KAI5902876.1 hypothetical protein K4G60_g2020 [Candida parapsilosis]